MNREHACRGLIDCGEIQSTAILWDQSVKDACISVPEAEEAIFLHNNMPPVGTLIAGASPKADTAMAKEETSAAENIATEALPSLGESVLEVDAPNPPEVVMQDTPDITPMGQPEPYTALEKPMQDVPSNPLARGVTRVKEQEPE